MRSPRFDLNPAAEDAISGLDRHVATLDLDPSLLELVRIRASQMNGCVYCIDMHTKDARARGESEQRLYALASWRDVPYFNDRERAALAWTEALTRTDDGHVSDAVWEEVQAHLDEEELAGLLMAVLAINAWNRVAIAQRLVPGRYVSPHGEADR